MVTTRRGVGAYRAAAGLALFAGYGFQTVGLPPPAARPVRPRFGFLLAGERLSGRGWLGAGLILAGILIAELGGRRPEAPGRPRTDGGQP